MTFPNVKGSMKFIRVSRGKDGKVVYQVRLRMQKGTEINSSFNISFDDLPTAQAWIVENLPVFKENPGKFHMWLAALKKEARENQEFVQFGRKTYVIRDHIILTRPPRK